jgi:phosphomethylpyrimidine synthase
MKMTQRTEAKRGMVTKEMKKVSLEEGVSSEWLRKKVASGHIVIPANRKHKGLRPIGIGEGLRIKVNTNLGSSSDHIDMEEELKKLKVSIQAGTDTVMDLSTGGDLKAIRKEILKHADIPLGTVPIYQAAVEAVTKRRALAEMTEEDIFDVIERQAEEGVGEIQEKSSVKQIGSDRHPRQC